MEQAATEIPAGAQVASPVGTLTGVLHVYVAFDMGEAILLPRAKELIPAEFFQLPRDSRTPTSIRYRPRPLRCRLDPVTLSLPGLGSREVTLDATLFDFGAASVAMHVPFQIPAVELLDVANGLSEPASFIAAAERSLRPLFGQITPAIEQPAWSELIEEYIVFQLFPEDPLPSPDALVKEHAAWVARLIRLDASMPAHAEVEEALKLHIGYSPSDLVVPDWAAALVVDRECPEILETTAFANVQLLELRHIDERLDRRLEEAYAMTRRLARTWLPFWRPHTRTVRALGELRVEINESMDRATNALKLIGDQYLARVYQRLVSRFHLDEWTRSVDQSLGALEGIYRIVADQAATYRAELLELIIVLLIVIEIVMSLVRR